MPGVLKSLALAALAAAATLGAGPAQSQIAPTQVDPATRIAPIEVTSHAIRVSYADLNLDTSAGMAVMGARIRRASWAVCGVDPQPLSTQMRQLDCVDDAKQDAYAQLAAARTMQQAEARQAEQVLVLAFER